ncbi:MAG: single-stranded DNA-binding protein, partial [Actinomycetota bacterium]
ATASITRRAREGGAPAVESPWGETKAPASGAAAWANPADPAVDEAPF